MKTGFATRSWLSLYLCFICTCVLFAGVIQAQPTAPITFLDGGYAELCSTAAHNIADREGVIITGSRAPIPPLQLCTLAIREGDSKGISLAASYTNRGVLHFANGAIDAAMADFDAAVRLDDSMAQTHINRGYIFNLRQQWEQSIAAFNLGIALSTKTALSPADKSGEFRTLETVPAIARAYYGRGIAHEELGHNTEAYRDYLRAFELAPDWSEPTQELERFTVVRRN